MDGWMVKWLDGSQAIPEADYSYNNTKSAATLATIQPSSHPIPTSSACAPPEPPDTYREYASSYTSEASCAEQLFQGAHGGLIDPSCVPVNAW